MAATEQIPEAAIKAVARRLKHYIDVERREEGFDSSGPDNPLGHYHVGKGLGGTFHYNSLQDKHMQHFYHQPLMRKHLIEKGIVQPGMFCSKHLHPRQRSKSSGQRAGKISKKESTVLMENSSRILAEKGSQLELYVRSTMKRSHSYGSGSAVLERADSAVSSNYSKSKKSGSSTPQSRRRRDSSGSHRTDVDSNVSSRRSTLSKQSREDATGGGSQRSLEQCPAHYSPSRDGQGGDLPDAPSCPSLSGQQHRQLINPLHQCQTDHQYIAGGGHSTFSTPPSLSIQAGIGVVNVRSRSAVMQESVGVSTISCCDASTQTLIHAETQTDQSTLLKMAMRHSRRTKWRKKSQPTRELESCTATIDVVGPSETTVSSSGLDSGPLDPITPSRSDNMEMLDDNTLAIVTATRESKVHTYIHQLVASGDMTKLREILTENPALVNSVDEQGHVPLHIACIAGKRSVIKILASHGANLVTESPTGYTAMHCAAMYGNLECLEELLSMKCEVNHQTIDKQTPLHLAAMSGQMKCCQWLVDKGANVNSMDNNGRTPCDIAKENDHQDIVDYLHNNDSPQKTKSDISLPLSDDVSADLEEANVDESHGTNEQQFREELDQTVISQGGETHTISSEHSPPNRDSSDLDLELALSSNKDIDVDDLNSNPESVLDEVEDSTDARPANHVEIVSQGATEQGTTSTQKQDTQHSNGQHDTVGEVDELPSPLHSISDTEDQDKHSVKSGPSKESLTSIVKVGVAGDAGLSQENDGFWEDSHDQ